MSYRVEWTPDTENDLAALWNAATDRGAVTAATAWLDARLARDPIHLGQPWGSSVHRVAVRDPIGVEFEVIEDDKRVIVHGVFAAG
jgi:hypothetical protein